MGENNRNMNVAIAINNKFIKYAYVLITSLFENHKDRNINLYILYNGISIYELEIFERLEIKYNQRIICQEISEDNIPQDVPKTDYWPMAICFRLFLPLIVPDSEDRVLYLDTDVIVNKNIEEFYDQSFEGKSLIACRDISVQEGGLSDKQRAFIGELTDVPEKDYFNSGVIIINLEKIRQYGREYYLDALEKYKDKLVAVDQDLLNYVAYNDVNYSDPYRYNCFARIAYNKGIDYENLKESASIIHYAGRKPWTPESIRYNSELIWWEYAKKTDIYSELLEEVLIGEIKSDYVNKQYETIINEKNELMNMLIKLKTLIK